MKTYKYLCSILLFILVSMSCSLTVAEASLPSSESITERLDALPQLRGASIAVSIRSVRTGEILYQYNGDKRLSPASNMKLFTGAAALQMLGPKHTFHTEIHTDGKQKWKVLFGNLYLVGKGDPTLSKTELDQFAKALKEQGIDYISGDLIGDDSWYDDVRYSIDLPWSDEQTYYGAPISALTTSPTNDYNAGSILITITPSDSIDAAPLVQLTPPTTFVSIKNKARTTKPTSKPTITLDRNHLTNTVLVVGEIPRAYPAVKESIAITNPTNYTLTLFQESLEEQGIKVLGSLKRGEVPNKTIRMMDRASVPLEQLVVPFMKQSNNTIAEILIKEMGKKGEGEGSWDSGLAVEKRVLTEMGVSLNGMVFRDGSGISHLNLTTANTVTNLLFVAQDQPWFHSFYESLPVAGIEEKQIGGTLKGRFIDSPFKGKIVAKTGSLTNVSSLSGYLENGRKKEYIFAIMMNHLSENQNGKEMEEKIINLLFNE
ncbi:D-alanyl-D-alanine carboxypeptidase/D-alanyl-D-alanine endopeptidase [Metabacillus sp. HB246100]